MTQISCANSLMKGVVRENIALQVWTQPSDERHKRTPTSRGVAGGAVVFAQKQLVIHGQNIFFPSFSSTLCFPVAKGNKLVKPIPVFCCCF